MQIKLFAIIGISLVLCSTANGQSDTDHTYSYRHYISGSVGFAYPINGFASSVNTPFVGVAPGQSAKFYATMNKTQAIFGWAGMLGYCRNSFSVGNSFTELYLGIGPCWDIPVGRLKFNFRLLLGPAIDKSPSINYGAGGSQSSHSVLTAPADAGADIAYAINKNFGISLSNDIFFTHPFYGKNLFYLDDARIFLWNITAGISYNIGSYEPSKSEPVSFLDTFNIGYVNPDTIPAKPKFYIGVNGGSLIPLAKFRVTDANAQGGAVQGGLWNISAGYPFGRSHFGVALMAGAGTNAFNDAEFSSLVTPFQEAMTVNSETGYKERYGLLGPLFTVTWEPLTFDFRLLGGEFYYETPTINYTCTPAVSNPPPTLTSFTPLPTPFHAVPFHAAIPLTPVAKPAVSK